MCRSLGAKCGVNCSLPMRGRDATATAGETPTLLLLAARIYNVSVGSLQNLKITLEMIKWEHSIFALPFALCGAMLAAGGLPACSQLGWIVVAMISARSAAMAFNRLADASIDAANPRTATRALPAGVLTPGFVTTFVLISCGIFVLAASQLNRLALWLSPGAGSRTPLFLLKTIHALVASVPGIRTRHRSGSRLDRGTRIARSANFAAHGCGDVLGWRIRCDLRLPGL